MWVGAAGPWNSREHSGCSPRRRRALARLRPPRFETHPQPGTRHGAPWARRTSRCFDLEDLVLHRAARSGDLDGLALLVADDRLANGRLVRKLVLRRVRLGGADDVVLDGLLGGDVPELHLRADGDDVLRDVLLVDHLGVAKPLLQRRDPVLEQRLLVLGVVVLSVLGDVAELSRDPDPLRDLAAFVVRQVLDLLLELLVPLRSKDDFLHNLPFLKENAAADAPSRARIVAIQSVGRNTRDL